jgi:hypothetical protein
MVSCDIVNNETEEEGDGSARLNAGMKTRDHELDRVNLTVAVVHLHGRRITPDRRVLVTKLIFGSTRIHNFKHPLLRIFNSDE